MADDEIDPISAVSNYIRESLPEWVRHGRPNIGQEHPEEAVEEMPQRSPAREVPVSAVGSTPERVDEDEIIRGIIEEGSKLNKGKRSSEGSLYAYLDRECRDDMSEMYLFLKETLPRGGNWEFDYNMANDVVTIVDPQTKQELVRSLNADDAARILAAWNCPVPR